MIEDNNKEKEQLLAELSALRRENAQLRQLQVEPVQAKEALQESEREYKEFADQLPETAVEFDENGNFTFVNMNGLQTFGYTRQDIERGLNVFQTIAPEDHNRAKESVEKVLRGEKSSGGEYTMVKKDGSRFPAFIHGNSVTRDNKVAGLRAIVIDISERKQAEEALRESEERFRILTETIDAVFWMTDVQTDRTFYVSPGYERVWGRSRESLYDNPKSFIEAIHPEDRARAVAKFEVKKAGQAFGHEYRIVLPDRSIRWIWDRWFPIRSAAGQVTRYAGIASDITDRTRAEEAVKESEERYRIAIEGSIDGVVIVQNDLHAYVNQAFLDMFGYEALDEIVGKERYCTIHPDDHERVVGYARARQKGEYVPARYEFKGIRKDGTPIDIEVSANTISYKGEKAILAYLRDITGRKRLEKEVIGERSKLKTLSDNAPFGMALIDKEGHFTYANPKLTELFGFDLPDIPDGRTWFRKAYPNTGYRRTVISAWREDSRDADSGALKPRVFTVTCKDGTQKIINFITSVLISGDYLMVCEDITELKHLESQLRHSQKMEAIGTLAGGIAHDFNNILTVITGFGTLLQMEMDEGSPSRIYVDQILSGSEKAAQLTRTLLAFSRQQPIALRPLNINETIGGAEKLLKRLLTEDIAVRTLLAPDEIIVMADATQIEQILFNLATNARDAMPRGGVLTIETNAVELDREFKRYHGYGEPGRYALLSVSDTGTGMDEATKEKIFDPFFTTKQVGKGTGLGLSSVYGLVKQHDGYITVYSESNMGTTFHIYLPVVAKGVEEEEPVPLPVK